MKTLIAFSIIAALAAPAAAQTTTGTTATTTTTAADIAGTWDVTFNAQQGPIPGKLTFKKDGAKIIGTLTSQLGESPLEAEVKGKAVTVWFSVTMSHGPIAIQLEGTAEGDTMKGSIGAGGQTAGTWEATRATDAKDVKDATTAASPTATAPTTSTPSLTGTWNVTIELPNMTATPTMLLKQDGEKVTGEYVSAQYGKFPMAGTLKGTDVVMSFQMNLEGTSLNVTYAGKLEKDGAMKGSVTYGDMMSGTFVAAKSK